MLRLTSLFDPRVESLSRGLSAAPDLTFPVDYRENQLFSQISNSMFGERRWWCNKSGRRKEREGGTLHNSQRTIGFVNKLLKPGSEGDRQCSDPSPPQSALCHPSIHPSLNAVLIGRERSFRRAKSIVTQPIGTLFHPPSPLCVTGCNKRNLTKEKTQ